MSNSQLYQLHTQLPDALYGNSMAPGNQA